MLPTFLRVVLRTLVMLVAAVFLYLGTAAVAAFWPLNRHRQPPTDGIEVWLRSNGVHVDLVLPVNGPAHDWSAHFPLSTFPDPPRHPQWVAFGWGAREFFVNVREWKDLDAGLALRALMRAPTVLHVEYLHDTAVIAAAGSARRMIVTGDEHALLVHHVRASLAVDAFGRLQLLPGMSYAGSDNFYAGAGTYTPVETCNEWVNAGLKEAGLPAPLWSPFAWGLMRD